MRHCADARIVGVYNSFDNRMCQNYHKAAFYAETAGTVGVQALAWHRKSFDIPPQTALRWSTRLGVARRWPCAARLKPELQHHFSATAAALSGRIHSLRKWTSAPSLRMAIEPLPGTQPVTSPTFWPFRTTVSLPRSLVTTQLFHSASGRDRSLAWSVLSVFAPLLGHTLPAVGRCSCTWIDLGQIWSLSLV